MSAQLRQNMSRMREQIAAEGDLVAAAIARSFVSFQEQNRELARDVIAADHDIDRAEIDLEEALCRLLALHHPVAGDLRFFVGVLKINNHLERMGDLAKNVAKRVMELPPRPTEVGLPEDFRLLAHEAQRLSRASLACFQQDDAEQARRILVATEAADALRRTIEAQLHQQIALDPANASYLLGLVSIARHFSRLANMAKHIAEEVIRIVEGQIVRHGAAARFAGRASA